MRRSASAALLAALALACGGDREGLVTAHGTVEVDEIALAPMTAARVVSMRVDEGDAVGTGDTVAVLSVATLPAAAAGEAARLSRAEAALRDLRAGARTAELEAAAAALAGADAEATQTQQELERVRALAEAGATSRQALDRAIAASTAAASRRDAAAAALRLMRNGARTEQIRAAEAEVAAARAAVAAVSATADELVLTSPVDGLVLGRYAEAGEVLAAGTPAAAVGETGRPWVRVYLSARALAGIRNGQLASIALDGWPGRRFGGTVAAVSPEAEFTPRVALTEDERADLLFAVKVAIEDTTGSVRPGLSAVVTFDGADSGAPESAGGGR